MLSQQEDPNATKKQINQCNCVLNKMFNENSKNKNSSGQFTLSFDFLIYSCISPNFNSKQIIRNIKSNLHYTGIITPKRVTSGGAIFASKRLGNTAPKKLRSGGEPLVLLCPGRPTRESKPRPSARNMTKN